MLTSITQEDLLKRLDYDPETGIFIWKHRPEGPANWNARLAGKAAGTLARQNKINYLLIRIAGTMYRSHRLAWLAYYGRFPTNHIDHIDGNGLNNRITNLRDVPIAENNRNAALHAKSSSGVAGVYWHKGARKWVCRVMVEGRRMSGGHFTNLEDAEKRVKELRAEHGFHPNHGKTRENRAI